MISQDLANAMLTLIYEISEGEHEAFEVSACQKFIDDRELWDRIDVDDKPSQGGEDE